MIASVTRLLARFALGLSIAGVATLTPAQDFPKLKAGLWKVAVSAAGAGPKSDPRVSTLCLDDSVQQEMYKMSTGMMTGMCSKHDIKIAGNKVTTLADCNLGITKMKSQSIMTLTGDIAYHTEAHATFDPPMNGMKESTSLIDGTYAGACKPGQQPGDMTLPSGQTVNVRELMGRKG